MDIRQNVQHIIIGYVCLYRETDTISTDDVIEMMWDTGGTAAYELHHTSQLCHMGSTSEVMKHDTHMLGV